MATVLGGAVVLAVDPLRGPLSLLGVQVSLAVTIFGLAGAISLSVLPGYWPHWKRLPGFERWSRLEAELGYVAALWSMAEAADSVNQDNLIALRRLENIARIASVLSAVSALGLLAGAVLAALSVL